MMPARTSLGALAPLLAGVGLLSCAALAGIDHEYVVGKPGGAAGSAAAGGAGGAAGDGGTAAAGGMGAGGGVAGSGGAVVTYVDVVLADGPLAYWRFGESDGATAVDSSGNNLDAVYNGNIVRNVDGAIVGDPDKAIRFPGDGGGHVSHNHGLDNFIGVDPFTLETWFMPDGYDGTYRHLYNKDYDPGGSHRHNIGLFVTANSDALGFERHIESDRLLASAPGPGVDSWHHIVATYDGISLRLYVNGGLAGETPDPRIQNAKPVETYIGAKRPDDGVLMGALDEFAIYDYALLPGRIEAHYDKGRGQ